MMTEMVGTGETVMAASSTLVTPSATGLAAVTAVIKTTAQSAAINAVVRMTAEMVGTGTRAMAAAEATATDRPQSVQKVILGRVLRLGGGWARFKRSSNGRLHKLIVEPL